MKIRDYILGNRKYQLKKLLILFVFFIPINIYIIGDWLGAGVQFSLLRIQTSYLGNSIISLINDLQYVLIGVYIGVTAVSIFFWTFGVLVLIFSILFFFFPGIPERMRKKRTGIMIILSTLLFLFSIVIQYGLYFNGPAGTAIPIGLPVLFIIGGWLYYEGSSVVEKTNEENIELEED